MNLEGTMFCDSCGIPLHNAISENATIPTRQLKNDPDDLSAKGTWGIARLGPGSSIIIHIRDAAEPLTIMPSPRITFGRFDNTISVNPDIDLTPYGALEKGVSRMHAIIEFSDDTVMISDAGSANGTYLNGQRVTPNQPRILRDGDEVRFGKIIAHIYFK
jgi:hypothetical protein